MATVLTSGLKLWIESDIVSRDFWNFNTSIIDTHINNVSNPHGVTAHQVGAYTQTETDAKIAALVNSAPATLDTLKELADALGDDPNFATTMTNLIGTKAPLISPTLTGIPTAPTAAGGTNTTQLATTAFVQNATAAFGLGSYGKSVADANAALLSGFYYVSANAANVPTGVTLATYLLVEGLDSANSKQTLFDRNTGNEWVRQYKSGVWQPWTKFVIADSSGNINLSSVISNSLASGAIYNYRDLIASSIYGTGTIKITLPGAWTASIINLKISGMCMSTSGAWDVTIGGYLRPSSNNWYYPMALLSNNCPFGTVRFGFDGTNACILLGVTTNSYNTSALIVKELSVGNSNTASYGSGWSISLITDESSITFPNAQSPVVKTIATTDLLSSYASLTGANFTGNVGINTAAPDNPLSVFGVARLGSEGLGGSYARNGLLMGTNGNYSDIVWQHYGANKWSIGIDPTTDSAKLHFRLAGTDKAVFDANGKLGIGTTSPNTALSVYINNTTGVYTPLISGQSGSTTTTSIDTVSENASAGLLGLSLKTLGSSGLTEKVRISSSGNVGIGTASPSNLLELMTNGINIIPLALSGTDMNNNTISMSFHPRKPYLTNDIAEITGILDIGSNGSESGSLSFSTRYSGTLNEHMRILSNGNVGIGTTAPNAPLYVAASTNPSIVIGDGNTPGSADRCVYIKYDTTNNVGAIGAYLNGSGAKNFVLQPYGGNVGVGTSSPQTTLHSTGSTILGIRNDSIASNQVSSNQMLVTINGSVLTLFLKDASGASYQLNFTLPAAGAARTI